MHYDFRYAPPKAAQRSRVRRLSEEVCNAGQRRARRPYKIAFMAIGNAADLNRIVLQIERAAVARAHLSRLLKHADTALAAYRVELRLAKARMKRSFHRAAL